VDQVAQKAAKTDQNLNFWEAMKINLMICITSAQQRNPESALITVVNQRE
jgi:hypothetical protein